MSTRAQDGGGEEAANLVLYRKAVREKWLPRHPRWFLKAAIAELGVIVGVGIASAVASLVHWKWWSASKEITWFEVLGDAAGPMVGGALITLLIHLWRWHRSLASSRAAVWASDQGAIAVLSEERDKLRAEQLALPPPPNPQPRIVRQREPESETETVLLEIKNWGGPATFHAEMYVRGNDVDWPKGIVHAKWSGRNETHHRMVRNERGLLELAELETVDDDPLIKRWHFTHWAPPPAVVPGLRMLVGVADRHSAEQFVLDGSEAPPKILVEVLLFSEPETEDEQPIKIPVMFSDRAEREGRIHRQKAARGTGQSSILRNARTALRMASALLHRCRLA